MSDVELKPCPWCGSTRIEFGHHVVSAWCHAVRCKDCKNYNRGVSIYVNGDHKQGRLTKQEGDSRAIALWNTRA